MTCGLLQALPAWNTNEVTLTFMPRLEGLQLALLKWIQTFLNISLLKYSQISLQVHESVHLSGPIAARSPHGGEDHPLCIQSDGASKGEYGIGVSHKKAAWAPSVTTPSSSQVGKASSTRLCGSRWVLPQSGGPYPPARALRASFHSISQNLQCSQFQLPPFFVVDCLPGTLGSIPSIHPMKASPASQAFFHIFEPE